MDQAASLVIAAGFGVGAVLIILMRWLIPHSPVLHFTSWGEGRGRVGSWALVTAPALYGLFHWESLNAYLVFSFLPWLLTAYWRERRGDFNGQSIFYTLSYLLAGVGLQGENSFLDRLAWPEVPSTILAALLIAAVTTGFRRLVSFRGATSWWTFVALLNITFLANSVEQALNGVWLAAMVAVNGLWCAWRKQDDVDDWGAAWLGFWIASQSLTLELSGVGSHDLVLWFLLMALPIFEAVSGLPIFLMRSAENENLSFIPHLSKVGFRHYQAIIYLCGLGLFSGLTSWTVYEARSNLQFVLTASMGITGIGLFLGFAYLIRRQKENHVNSMSQTLLQRYLNFSGKVRLDPENFQAVAYDLLPYYRKLEEQGIGEVQGFLHDFAEFLRKRHESFPVLLIGSYTVLVVEHRLEPPGRFLTDTHREFFAFLESHRLAPSASPAYYSTRSKPETFMNRFGHLLDFGFDRKDGAA